MSTEETYVPKRRSSSANRRRRSQTAAAQAPKVESNASKSTTTEAVETVEKVERHIQRRDDRKAAKSRKDERHGVARVVDTQRFSGVRKFIDDTMSEIRKVQWPDRVQTRNLTLLVICLSAILGVLLGGIDWVMLQIFEAIG